MKVVIFCGGLGVRMGEETQRIPKPMIEIGGKPILWHIMRYYSMWGHNEFILALGYKAEIVKQYFLSYNGALFNDFVLGHSAGETTLEMLSRDLDEWQITFLDTGPDDEHRRPAASGRALPRRRRGLPRDLRRRSHRRAARSDDPDLRRVREDRDVPLGPHTLQRPPR